jgi:hypothetical protein
MIRKALAIVRGHVGGIVRKLDFVLPDFTRTIWASEEAKRIWVPRIAKISLAWEKIERLRPNALQLISPTDLIKVSEEIAHTRKIVLPLQMQGMANSYYQTVEAYDPSKKWGYRVAICSPFAADMWVSAWKAQDNNAIGRILGYPKCCRAFFERVWGPNVDTTWEMAIHTPNAAMSGNKATIGDGTFSIPASNILLRWIGVRLVSHLPCSFNCAETLKVAQENWDLGKEEFGEELLWIQEMLSWPIEWSALHGIAEIKTPILKISTRTDATPEKYTVRYMGNTYPLHGARGNVFPYRKESPKVVDMWTENGFTSLGAMREAHNVLLPLIPSGLNNVLDLGCGNGALLKQIECENRYGIDHIPGVINSARSNIGTDTFAAKSIGEDLPWDVKFDLTLLMAGRMTEMNPILRDQFHKWLRENTKLLLLYAYGDWLTNASIFQLAFLAGFSTDEWTIRASGAQKHSACLLLEKKFK